MRDEIHQFGHLFDERLSDAIFICLEGWTRRDNDRRPTLSFDLRSEAEVDEAIDALITDLEITRRDAKAALRRRAKQRSR